MSSSKSKIKRYEFKERIGKGNFAEVWKVIDNTTYNFCAIKILDSDQIKAQPKVLELLQSEIHILKTINNVNVVKLYDSFQEKGKYYLVMEYCNGGDLARYVQTKKDKCIPESEALLFFKQLLNGFKALHEIKAMHRDFKLPNVLIHDGTLKIADLGFSKQADLARTALGTGVYMAPEIMRYQKYTNKIDIWSLGICMYEMLFGKCPFFGRTENELLSEVEKNNLNFNANGHKISEDFQNLIKRMLIVDPAKRIDWIEIYNSPLLNKEAIKGTAAMFMSRGDVENQHQNMLFEKNKNFYVNKKNLEYDNAEIIKQGLAKANSKNENGRKKSSEELSDEDEDKEEESESTMKIKRYGKKPSTSINDKNPDKKPEDVSGNKKQSQGDKKLSKKKKNSSRSESESESEETRPKDKINQIKKKKNQNSEPSSDEDDEEEEDENSKNKAITKPMNHKKLLRPKEDDPSSDEDNETRPIKFNEKKESKPKKQDPIEKKETKPKKQDTDSDSNEETKIERKVYGKPAESKSFEKEEKTVEPHKYQKKKPEPEDENTVKAKRDYKKKPPSEVQKHDDIKKKPIKELISSDEDEDEDKHATFDMRLANSKKQQEIMEKQASVKKMESGNQNKKSSKKPKDDDSDEEKTLKVKKKPNKIEQNEESSKSVKENLAKMLTQKSDALTLLEKKYLHSRNTISHHAKVLQDGVALTTNDNAIYTYFILARRLMRLSKDFWKVLDEKENIFKEEKYFKDFVNSRAYEKISDIFKEQKEIYEHYFFYLQETLKNYPTHENALFEDLKKFMDEKEKNYNKEDANDAKKVDIVFKRVLVDFCWTAIDSIAAWKEEKNQNSKDKAKQYSIHMIELVDCCLYRDIFGFNQNEEAGFNFAVYQDKLREKDLDTSLETLFKKIDILMTSFK